VINLDELILLDTGLLLHLLQGKAQGRKIQEDYQLSQRPERPLISVVAVGEILAIARRQKYSDERRAVLDQLIRVMVVVDVRKPIAERFAEILVAQQAAGKPIGDNDTWIAATAKATGATLLTTDRGDFGKLPPGLIKLEIIDQDAKARTRCPTTPRRSSRSSGTTATSCAMTGFHTERRRAVEMTTGGHSSITTRSARTGQYVGSETEGVICAMVLHPLRSGPTGPSAGFAAGPGRPGRGSGWRPLRGTGPGGDDGSCWAFGRPILTPSISCRLRPGARGALSARFCGRGLPGHPSSLGAIRRTDPIRLRWLRPPPGVGVAAGCR
jgi:tRNA(fMet)-specific endonuclease VapC